MNDGPGRAPQRAPGTRGPSARTDPRAQALESLLRAAPRGPSSDAAEQHADVVADLLLPVLEGTLLRGPEVTGSRRPAPRDQTTRTARPGAAPAPGQPAEPAVAAATASPGEALPSALREALEPILGVDLEPVRLHHAAQAGDSPGALGSRAYAFGAHIVLGPGWGGPGTASGRRLLAHELAHVAVQAHQGQARVQHQAVPDAGAVRATQAGSSGGTGPTPPRFETFETGDDPAALIAQLPEVLALLRTVTLDAEAVANGVTPRILRPTGLYLYTENYIVVVKADGRVQHLFEQDTSRPTMISADVMALRENRTGRVWFLGERGGNFAIQAFRYAGVPAPGRPVGESALVAFMPGVLISAELARSLARRARGASGTQAEAPQWARDAAARLRRRRTGGAAAAGEGTGAGARGQGRGGGGAADRQTGTGTGTAGPTTVPEADRGAAGTGTGPGAGAGAAPPTGAPATPRPTGAPATPRPAGAPATPRPAGPLRGPATYTAGVSRTGSPQLSITIDRATTAVPLREGESAASLDRRVAAAEQALQESRDPNAHQSVAGGATATGFTPPPPGGKGAVVPPQDAQAQARAGGFAGTPGERVPGGRGGANAPPYPSQVTMAGLPKEEPAVSAAGATNRFTMALDYAARSLGFQDEVFNRMQSIQFYWEIIDVSGLTREQADARAAVTSVGEGERQSPLGAAGTDLSRTANAVAQDQQADLDMMREQNWPWEARASYLMVIGLSNTVRLLGSVIGSFIDAATQPLNDRSIGFRQEGDFIVRCVATPQWSDEAAADPEHHVLRASSVAVRPVRIASLGTRAAEGADREATSVAEARARLAAAERSGNPRTIGAARAALERLLTASRTGGFETFTGTLAALRRRLAVARELQAHRAAGAPDAALSDDEVLLEIQLIRTGQSLADHLAVAARQVTQFGGEANEHEVWVRRQHERFGAVGTVQDFRPRLALASEENGQVSEIRTMLGELTGSREGARRWALVDVTSSGSRDTYVGRSALPGHPGHVAAIRDAFRDFAENAGYGRGTLAIRLPGELSAALGAPVPIEAAMYSRPGASGRVMQRLRDLATVAEIAGIFATGGLGVAIGAVGGVAGAITAIDSLARRSRTGHLWEIGTIFDVLGVVGGVASTMGVGTFIARDVAEAGRAAGNLPSWINRLERTERAIHIHGTISNVQQLITIPVQLAIEWNEIDRTEGLTDGERDSRRARAFLGALKSGTITVVSMTGGVGGHEPPGRASRAGGAEAPLPAGTGAAQAHAVADGTGGPRPPTRETAPAESGTGAARAQEPGPGLGRPGEAADVPAVTDVAAQAQALARRRLVEARRAEVDAGGSQGRPGRPEEGPVREGTGDARTAAGTTREPAAPGRRTDDVNTEQRDLAVTILEVRLGRERPAGPTDATAPPPRPGPFGNRTTSAENAVASYDQAVGASRGAEVGLFFNPNTGEFAVQVGTEFSVRSPAGEGWQALVHLHPNAENVIVHRMPAPADIAMAVRAAFRSGRHTEFVQSTRPDGSTGITRVTVTTNPVRIVVEIPAAPGEPARRIDVPSPDAYAREYGDQSTYLDPTSPLYEWVLRDLDDYHRGRRREAEDELSTAGTTREGPGPGPDERTAVGTASPGRRVPTQDEAEATAEIGRLRSRLYAWRAAAAHDPAANAYIDLHLATLRDLAAAVRRGESVEGALHGIRADLSSQRRAVRPVGADRVTALAARTRRAAGRSRDPEVAAELSSLADAADRLAAQMTADPTYDARTRFDALDRQARRATRQDYEVFVDLGQPGERAQMMAWFEDHLAPLNSTPAGELLVRDILRHLDTADALTLAQSPRSGGIPVADTAAMRRQVVEGIATGRYSPEYTALFEAATRDAAALGFTDGWPRTPDGRAWEVDHVGELWAGGADDATNYLALPPAVHELKSSILGEFRAEFRSRSEAGESVDVRATDAPEREPTQE